MRFFTGIVKCATCGVALSKAVNVPETETLTAAIAASSRAFCEGHSKNSNLDFEWVAQEGKLPTPPSAPEPEAPAVEEKKFTADGIALEDLAEAAGEPIAKVPEGVYIEGENGVPLLVVGKNAPRADQIS